MATASRSNEPNRRKEEADEQPAATEETEQREHAKQTAKESEKILDEIDRVLKEALDLDPETATDEEFNKRSADFVKGMVQKGGQ